MNNVQKSPDKLKLLAKIALFEKEGRFDEDVDDNPPTKPLKVEDVDYLNKKLSSKIKRKIAYSIAKKYITKLVKTKKLIIKDVIGFDKITALDTGFILTCNHFNPYDNFALHWIFYPYLKKTKKHFYKVIREGNYSFPGLYGYFFRNCETLPLSSNFNTMKAFTNAFETILKRKDIILIYPEQAMWWNYRKPRPLKPGAFKYAQKFNVPVVPCFITMSDSDLIDEDGFNIQEYTVTFFDPIYPDESLPSKEATAKICDTNYQVWKQKYEEFYHIPLTYTNSEGEK